MMLTTELFCPSHGRLKSAHWSGHYFIESKQMCKHVIQALQPNDYITMALIYQGVLCSNHIWRQL